MRFHHSARTLCAAVGLIAIASGAQAAVLTFSESGFQFLSQGGGDEYYIWTAGDSWSQDFPATGLTSATHLDLHLAFLVNAIETLDMDVLVNNVDVGDFTLQPDGAFQNFSFDFLPIAGDDYKIDMVAKSTITGGAGAYNLLIDAGSRSLSAVSWANITPAPASLGLFALGGLGASRRRR